MKGPFAVGDIIGPSTSPTPDQQFDALFVITAYHPEKNESEYDLVCIVGGGRLQGKEFCAKGSKWGLSSAQINNSLKIYTFTDCLKHSVVRRLEGEPLEHGTP